MKTNQEGKDLIALFRDEYEPAESRTAAEKAINLYVHPALTSNQFSALVSLVMCIGIRYFRRSQMLKLINSGRLVKAADEFDRYIYVDDDEGKRLADPFMIKHREFEKALFLKPEIVRRRK